MSRTASDFRFRPRLRARARDQAGFAVPTVLLAVVASFALGSVAVVGAVTTQRGTVRDQNVKEAMAAADSGVNQALMHYNRIVTTTAEPCVVGTTATIDPVALAGRLVRPRHPGAGRGRGRRVHLLGAADAGGGPDRLPGERRRGHPQGRGGGALLGWPRALLRQRRRRRPRLHPHELERPRDR